MKEGLSKHSKTGNWQLKERGTKHFGLKEFITSNIYYERVLSYHLNRFGGTTRETTSRETGKDKDFIKKIMIPLLRHYFNGKDSIQVQHLLSSFTIEANIQKMLETKLFETLPSFLVGFSFRRYDSMVGMTPTTEVEIICWSRAVQYLLASHAQGKDIRKQGQGLWDTKQNPEKDEKQFARQEKDTSAILKMDFL